MTVLGRQGAAREDETIMWLLEAERLGVPTWVEFACMRDLRSGELSRGDGNPQVGARKRATQAGQLIDGVQQGGVRDTLAAFPRAALRTT